MRLTQPRTKEELARYFGLRWLVLRAPWDQPPGSERDEYEAQAFHLMVEDDSGNAIGVGRLHRTSASVGQVRYMAVAENRRHEGIGTVVLDKLEQRARQWAMRKVVLNARNGVVEFYRRRGYRMVGAGEVLFGSIEHTRMEKVLDPDGAWSD
jgi:N-acetylglutamate synthase-like GNAT family acetyltransferase